MCIDWTCDYCGAYLNSQPGFTTSDGTWRCTECGALNDVSDSNVYDPDKMRGKSISVKALELPDDADPDDNGWRKVHFK